MKRYPNAEKFVLSTLQLGPVSKKTVESTWVKSAQRAVKQLVEDRQVIEGESYYQLADKFVGILVAAWDDAIEEDVETWSIPYCPKDSIGELWKRIIDAGIAQNAPEVFDYLSNADIDLSDIEAKIIFYKHW